MTNYTSAKRTLAMLTTVSVLMVPVTVWADGSLSVGTTVQTSTGLAAITNTTTAGNLTGNVTGAAGSTTGGNVRLGTTTNVTGNATTHIVGNTTTVGNLTGNVSGATGSTIGGSGSGSGSTGGGVHGRTGGHTGVGTGATVGSGSGSGSTGGGVHVTTGGHTGGSGSVHTSGGTHIGAGAGGRVGGGTHVGAGVGGVGVGSGTGLKVGGSAGGGVKVSASGGIKSESSPQAGVDTATWPPKISGKPFAHDKVGLAAYNLEVALQSLGIDQTDYIYAYLQTVPITAATLNTVSVNGQAMAQLTAGLSAGVQLPTEKAASAWKLWVDTLATLGVQVSATAQLGGTVALPGAGQGGGAGGSGSSGGSASGTSTWTPPTGPFTVHLADHQGQQLGSIPWTPSKQMPETFTQQLHAMQTIATSLQTLQSTGHFVPAPYGVLPRTSTSDPVYVTIGLLLAIIGGICLVVGLKWRPRVRRPIRQA